MTHAPIRAHFTTSEELLNEVDQLVGPRRRSEFLNEAVSKELRRRKLIQEFEAAAGSLKEEPNVPAEWTDPELTLKWVNDLRAESDRARNI